MAGPDTACDDQVAQRERLDFRAERLMHDVPRALARLAAALAQADADWAERSDAVTPVAAALLAFLCEAASSPDRADPPTPL
jgi:hypothetical protein